jgi:predicted nucleic acid-binding protein
MIYLPDTNACISLLRQKQPQLIARWRSTKVADITLCSIVVYELRHGAESSTDPPREHGKLDIFLAPFRPSRSTIPAQRSVPRSDARSNGMERSSDRTISRSPQLPFTTT